MLLVHACWGALFIKLFGFSFQCLRLSTIPFSLGSVAVCYLLVRRAGLLPSFAFLVTLLLALSPLFLPVSVTYMTDIPCLFFILLSLYALSRAAEVSESVAGYFWVTLGAATALLGGTGRQVVWLVPLAVLPYLAWTKRRTVRFAAVSLAAWMLAAAGMAGISSWFNRQPYVAHTSSTLAELKLSLARPLWEFNIFARLALMLLLMILPAVLPLVFQSARETWGGALSRKLFVGLLLFALFGAVFVHPSLASIPWVSSTLNWEGINGTAALPERPIVLTAPIRAVVALVVYISVCILAGELWSARRLLQRAWRFLLDPPAGQFALAAMSLFSLVYFTLLIIRGSEIDLFDRYLLPIMPCAASVALLWPESAEARSASPARKPGLASWVTLAILAAYAILSTQDLWALARARVAAAQKLEAAGIPRTAIDAGLEYNGWTQLLATGHLNDRWALEPPGAYRPQFGTTPEVVPVYVLEYSPTAGTERSQFAPVPYFSLLPPFHKQVSIDRIRGR
jgi:hypothetical protein